jgi:hypothetical protein
MHQEQQPAGNEYPIGRGYGHDYMRGGEVFGGYGYSDRPEYARRRGEADAGDGIEDSGQRRRASDDSEEDDAG